jgi:hypothetical protein
MRQMRLRTSGLLLVIGLLVAACSSSGSATPAGATAPVASLPPSAGPTASSAPSAAPTPGPSKGPATAHFSLTGTAGLTGGVTITSISCDQPSLIGPQIEALGTATDGSGFVLFVTASHIEARVGTGAAATLKLRTFSGTGVSAFDAATGVSLDSDLTETTAPGAAIGSLGALSHLTGKLDCGNQQPGSADITISGASKFGPMSGSINQAKVTCTTSGSALYVTAQALTMAGTTPVLVFVNAGPTMLQLVIETGTAADIYQAPGAAASTITATGAQFSTDMTQNVKTGTPLVLHIEGSDTCGSSASQ